MLGGGGCESGSGLYGRKEGRWTVDEEVLPYLLSQAYTGSAPSRSISLVPVPLATRTVAAGCATAWAGGPLSLCCCCCCCSGRRRQMVVMIGRPLWPLVLVCRIKCRRVNTGRLSSAGKGDNWCLVVSEGGWMDELARSCGLSCRSRRTDVQWIMLAKLELEMD